MSENIEARMDRIIALCAQVERTAFLIPPPNRIATQLVSLAIYIRNEAEAVQAENFASGAQWTEEQTQRLLDKPA